MPATREQAYEDIRNNNDDPDRATDSTRLFLSGFDPTNDLPKRPVRPLAPRKPALAEERFAMPELAMAKPPTAGTACQNIATAVGGPKAKCVNKSHPDFQAQRPAGVSSDWTLYGLAYSDGRIYILDQPAKTKLMWDVTMHERAHVYAGWLCGRADCLNPKFEARGHAERSNYHGSLAEAFAQSWAECHGAARVPEYRSLPCADVEAVIKEAVEEKKKAKEKYDKDRQTFSQDMAKYDEESKNLEKRRVEHSVLVRAHSKMKTR